MIPLYAEKTREMNHRLKGRSGGRMQSFLPQPEKKGNFSLFALHLLAQTSPGGLRSEK
jgi:hypothetical protein